MRQDVSMVTKFDGLKPEVRDRLEVAVMEIFSNSDFHKSTMRDVAKKAGISFSTIYNYFGSKEKLLFAFVDVYLGKLTDRIVDHLQGIEDLKEKMRKVLWVQLDYYERHPALGRILFMTVPMQTWVADETFAQKKMFDLFMDVLRQGQTNGMLNNQVPTGVLLDIIMGFVQRSFFMWVVRGQRYSLSADTNGKFEMIWRAIANPNARNG
jgi:AcrR family transcriptional regulator